MTNSWNHRHGSRRSDKRYDRAGAVVLNRVKLGQAPISLHRIRWMHRGLWGLLALAVLGAGLALWLTVDARFYVYDVQIVGNRRLSHQEIFEASGLRGLHILWARSSVIESRILEALPSLESVEAGCRLPSECTISVVERRPRVLWDERSAVSGELWWIDEEGAVFLVRDGEANSHLTASEATQAESSDGASGRWVVTGPLPRDDGTARYGGTPLRSERHDERSLEEERSDRVQGNLDEQVRVALAELWESGRDLPTAFRYTPEQGLSFVDKHGWRIVVGQGPGMACRLQVMERLVAHLVSREVTPRFVDVRFPEAPYYVPATD